MVRRCVRAGQEYAVKTMTKVRLRGPPLNFSKAYQNLPWLRHCSNTQMPSACSADSSSSTTATTLNTPVRLPCTTCPLPLQRSAGGLRVRKPLTRSAGRRRCCAACNPVLQWLALWRHTVRGWGQNRSRAQQGAQQGPRGADGGKSEANGPPATWVDGWMDHATSVAPEMAQETLTSTNGTRCQER